MQTPNNMHTSFVTVALESPIENPVETPSFTNTNKSTANAFGFLEDVLADSTISESEEKFESKDQIDEEKTAEVMPLNEKGESISQSIIPDKQYWTDLLAKRESGKR